jgi:adenylosuccinate synthase
VAAHADAVTENNAMTSKEIHAIYSSVTKKNATLLTNKVRINPLKHKSSSVRPNSISIEEPFFGDSGKGRVATEFNVMQNKRHNLVSMRFNGGANAGHEVVMSGVVYNLHQLPMAVISEGATAIVSRTVLVHPDDLLKEASDIEEKFGGALPGKLLIDQNAVLSLDTHRAYEGALNIATTGGRGSTGRGISPGYMSFYGRIAVTIRDLMQPDWKETFRQHYSLYEKHVTGLGYDLKSFEVAILGNKGQKRMVGDIDEFIARLGAARSKMKQYVSSTIYETMRAAWENSKIPMTFEGAQGAGLDPYHGVYPDITASRPTSHSMMDATYAVVHPSEIALRVGVVKGPYMSSVGQRKLPTIKDETWEKWIQSEFQETGRSTGRLRDIYPVSIPMGQYLRRAAGFDYLAVTHLDASRPETPIKVITHYTNKKTKQEAPYLPFQYELDKLEAHAVNFKGWDGEQVKKAKTPKDLPRETLSYLSFLSKTLAPVIFATTGVEFGQSIKWF